MFCDVERIHRLESSLSILSRHSCGSSRTVRVLYSFHIPGTLLVLGLVASEISRRTSNFPRFVTPSGTTWFLYDTHYTLSRGPGHKSSDRSILSVVRVGTLTLVRTHIKSDQRASVTLFILSRLDHCPVFGIYF